MRVTARKSGHGAGTGAQLEVASASFSGHRGKTLIQYPDLPLAPPSVEDRLHERAARVRDRSLAGHRRRGCLAGPYTESCHVPVQRSLLIIRYEDGKPASTGDFVRPEKVPPYPC